MSKQVDFYLIENQISDAKYKLASRLSNKLLKLKKKTLIATDSIEETEQLSQLMWTFSGTSFVAHENVAQATEQSLTENLIHIGDTKSINNDVLENEYEVLINLCQNAPLFSHHFNRIAEIIEQTDDQKAAGRARYKNYQQEGFEIKTHSLEL